MIQVNAEQLGVVEKMLEGVAEPGSPNRIRMYIAAKEVVYFGGVCLGDPKPTAEETNDPCSLCAHLQTRLCVTYEEIVDNLEKEE